MKLDVSEGGTDSGAGGEGGGDADDDAKVIVRSNGTVTYVGKDIAYQLWKFGLLGRDFGYRRFYTYGDGRTVWTSVSSDGETGAPPFGNATDVFNVIDTRQAYLQNVVVAGLRALGFEAQAERSVHFSYEIVALTPRCAAEMGYTLSEEEARKPYVEVSGRKGLGVKADDLLDRLEAAARAEVDPRHSGAPESERAEIAHAIAIGALRYFLLKYTRTAIIAFDFKDALSFEGETGPYCQYAVVRARNIFRKMAEQDQNFRAERLFDAPDAQAAARELASASSAGEWAAPASARQRPQRNRRRTSYGNSRCWPVRSMRRWQQRSARRSQLSSPNTRSSFRRPSACSTTTITCSPNRTRRARSSCCNSAGWWRCS